MEIRERIREFLRSELKKNITGVADTESLLESGILDSMSVV